jgi:hypothetical protein
METLTPKNGVRLKRYRTTYYHSELVNEPPPLTARVTDMRFRPRLAASQFTALTDLARLHLVRYGDSRIVGRRTSVAVVRTEEFSLVVSLSGT